MIEHLVLSGSATNVLIQTGLLHYLIEQNIFQLSNIKSIHSTSAGAMISILLLLGVSIEEIQHYLLHRPWNKFFEFRWNEKSIFPSSYLYEMVKPFMLSNDISESYTLLDLYNKTNIDLYVYTTQLNDMISVSLHHSTHPTITLQEVILMTASLPILFSPIKYKDDYYIDGGVLNNCPLQAISSFSKESILIIEIINCSNKYTDDSNMLDYFNILSLNIFNTICSSKYNAQFIDIYPYYYRIQAESIFNLTTWKKFIEDIEYRRQLYTIGYTYIENKTTIETELELKTEPV
jgi:predicted acylesterase/phospholipase RssA